MKARVVARDAYARKSFARLGCVLVELLIRTPALVIALVVRVRAVCLSRGALLERTLPDRIDSPVARQTRSQLAGDTWSSCSSIGAVGAIS